MRLVISQLNWDCICNFERLVPPELRGIPYHPKILCRYKILKSHVNEACELWAWPLKASTFVAPARGPTVNLGFRGQQQHHAFCRLWRKSPRWFHFDVLRPPVVGRILRWFWESRLLICTCPPLVIQTTTALRRSCRCSHLGPKSVNLKMKTLSAWARPNHTSSLKDSFLQAEILRAFPQTSVVVTLKKKIISISV